MSEQEKLNDTDLAMMQKVIAMANGLAEDGVHPFAALLVDSEGTVLMEQGNAYLPDKDMTGHAERVLMTRASKTWRSDFLAGCTMYVSAEPCCMCAGSAYWAGLGRVVYGLSEHRLKNITGNHPENPTLDLPCRQVFESGQREVEVIGPVLEDAAAKVHEIFWQKHGR